MLEKGRNSLQVLHEYDACCFHGHSRHDAILGYGERITDTLNGTGGMFATAISDWKVHEWDERSRTIVAAGLIEAKQAAPDFFHLPCDILHHSPTAVDCPFPPTNDTVEPNRLTTQNGTKPSLGIELAAGS